jgi:RNA polymerase sigma factor (sigma-70 family)
MVRVLPVEVPNALMDRLASLFDVHYDRLYRLARRLSPSADEALDLVQETFLKATRSAKSIPIGATDEEAWLVCVLINIRRDQWRKKSVRDRHDQAQFEAGQASHLRLAGRDQEAELIAKNTVWQALDILPPRRRAVVVMHELEDLPIPSIASLLGINEITVRWHLSKGRRDLKREVRNYLGGTNGRA